ncbi:MAG: GTP cyclohydrolase I FolE [Muribaculaceae bacterium]|nr:GTP cyclohydrolase I FolE [Muribaculaceae bacterium]
MKYDHDPKLVEQIAHHYREIIKLVGEDPNREGLLNTPVRAAKALLDNTHGYHDDARAIARSAVFEHPGSDIVIVDGLEFYSLCEHHILPFFGTAAIGYVPDGKIIGLSKLARVVDTYARRLQVQERLTAEVCDAVADSLPNKGVIVVIKAQHLCMKMRGVEKQSSATTTMHFTGCFENKELRDEFFRLLDRQS